MKRLKVCSLNYLVRIGRITEQTKHPSGVSAGLNEKLSSALDVAVCAEGISVNDLLLSWFLCNFRCSH